MAKEAAKSKSKPSGKQSKQQSAKQQSSSKGPAPEPMALDERLETLVNEVWQRGPLTVRDLQATLPWSRPTLRRVLREAERLGVIMRDKGAFTRDAPGRPSDVWTLA